MTRKTTITPMPHALPRRALLAASLVGLAGAPRPAAAQAQGELVIVSFAGQLQELGVVGVVVMYVGARQIFAHTMTRWPWQ